MKKIITLIISFVLLVGSTKAQTPYSAKFTTVNGTQVAPTDAYICPSNGGYATLKAYAEWPFGVGYLSVKYLYIAKGNTYHLPCGAVADYDSVRIDSGGTLMIDDYNGTGIGTATGTPWTVLGCKGAFVLNGIIQCNNGTHHGGTWQLIEPDSTGSLIVPSISITITQKNGGNGGNGGSGGTNVGYYPSQGFGGSQYNGNGGGGGGGALANTNTGIKGTNGGNANDTISGFGGNAGNDSCQSPITNSVTLYGNNGLNGAQYTCSGGTTAGSSGGSGGTRGMHGGLLFIKAMQSITGKGTINVSGQNGGNGGSGEGGNSVSGVCYSGPGGGGGAGAGGSGGYVYVKYVGSTPSITVNKAPGNGGQGGITGCCVGTVGTVPGSDGNTNGIYGDTGIAGAQQFLPIQGFTYQWRKNGSNITGATVDTLDAYSAGRYDCKITNLTYSKSYYTSGTLGINKDTVFTDSSVTAQVTSVSSINICQGDSSTLTAKYVVGQNYQWYFNSSPATGTGAGTSTYYATQSGNYVVYASNSCANPTASTPVVTITVNPLPGKPVLTASGATTFCQGDSVKLTSSDATGNAWNTGATTQSITVKTSGVYTVTYTNANGCKASNDSTVTVKPASVTAPDTAITCGNNVQLNAVCNPLSPTSIVWSPATFLSNANIVNPICTPTTSVTYTVTATLNNGCMATDTVRVTNNPAANLNICIVTTDTGSLHNIIVWNTTGLSHVDSIKIYFYNASNQWQKIGEQLFSAPAQFIDNTPINNPNNNTVRYCITEVDSCGNEEPIASSPWQNTCHINQAPAGTFTWSGTGYLKQGVTQPVATYYLMRDSLSNNNWIIIDSCSGTQNTMSDGAFQANPGNYPLARWKVNMKLSDSVNTGCSMPDELIRPHAANNVSSRSNVSHNTAVTGINTAQNNNILSVYPNPVTQILNVKFGAIQNQDAEITITDIAGRRVMLMQKNITADSNLAIDVSSLTNGLYFIQVKTTTQQQAFKFIKQ